MLAGVVCVAGAFIVALIVSGSAGGEPAPEPVTQAATDPLVARGHAVTGGAAPGYVADELCGSCHRDLYESFQDVGMARSFYKPRASNLIEDFSKDYYHEKSRRHYEMVHSGDGRLTMKRYQLDADGGRINAVEQEIDWILGSGNHSRTYLYRTPEGDLFQLPIAWYTQTRSWGMAPGFDSVDHLGLLRRVRRECMFCHNAYPDVPAGSDVYDAPHTFPAELPEGVGCQRCHGPGEGHARAAMRESVDFDEVYATILNPSDLEPRLRDDVCYQCHMQPTVVIPGQRRFGRDVYSYRPGEPLDEYLVQVDVDEAGQSREERFEINHHPYRLEQSRCFAASAGKMSCLSCHDPHRKVPEAERVAHYRAACLECHEVDACQLEEMSAGAALPEVAADDCAGCHMPKRRSQDVVQVVMTDHLIRRRPGGPELLAPLAERHVVLDDVTLLDSASAPRGELAEIYRAFAVTEFSAGGYGEAVDHLERMLARTRLSELEPYFALARGQLKQGRPAAARSTLLELLETSPDYPKAHELVALTEANLGNPRAAVGRILEALERGHERPETLYNLGVFLTQYRQPEGALRYLERAIELRPTMDAAWFYRGKAERALGRSSDAVRSFRQTVTLNPTHGGAYLALGELLLAQDRRDEALRYLRHGLANAEDPEPIAQALSSLESRHARARKAKEGS